MYLCFLKTLFGLIILFSFLLFLSFHILSFFHKTPCFLNGFRLHGFFFSKKKNCFSCLLVLNIEKYSFVFFLSSFFSSQEKLPNDNLFYHFLTFFFELFTFFSTNSVGKTSCFVFFGLFFFSCFSFICFSCRFSFDFLDLLRNMLPFKSVFFTALFPLLVHPLSICSLSFLSPLVFSFPSPFLPL